MLMTIPGVGRELGEKLLERCDSLEEMRYEESMRGVKGLGKVLKRRIIDVLTSEEPVKFERKMRR